MKIRNSIKIIALSVVVSALFVGCGSSSNDAVATASALTGTFVDAPAQGLSYKTPTQSGFTDASGQFKYKSGEEVEFKLGNLVLGKGTAAGLVTPYSISNNNDTAINIALLLQNFDGNRTNTGVLDLSLLKDANLSDVNLSANASDMQTKLGNLFSDNRFASRYSGSVLLDAAAVKGAMDTYLNAHSIKYDKKFTQHFLDTHDFYEIDASYGPQRVRFRVVNSTNERQIVGDGASGFDATFDNRDDFYITTYAINNGKITINHNGQGITVTEVKSISQGSISVTEIVTESNNASHPVGQINKSIWYMNMEDAKVAYSASLVTNGFSQVYLDNTVFYKTSNEYPQYKNQYRDGKIYFAGDEDNGLGWDDTFSTASSTYTIVNGVINASFSDGSKVTAKITNTTNSSIEVLETHAVHGSRTSTWYTSKAAAEASLQN